MKRSMILSAVLLTLCISVTFTGCGSKGRAGSKTGQ